MNLNCYCSCGENRIAFFFCSTCVLTQIKSFPSVFDFDVKLRLLLKINIFSLFFPSGDISLPTSHKAFLLIRPWNLLWLLFVQSESTLWKLKFFVKSALELQAKNSASKADDICKRKKEICDAPAKTAKKRNKKLSSWYYFISLWNPCTY